MQPELFPDAWKTDDLIFVWKEGDPVQIDDGLHLPRFTLEKFQTAYCNSKTNTGTPLPLTDARYLTQGAVINGTSGSLCQNRPRRAAIWPL